MGWKRTMDKRDDNYRLKWCELKSNINYYTFKEGITIKIFISLFYVLDSCLNAMRMAMPQTSFAEHFNFLGLIEHIYPTS